MHRKILHASEDFSRIGSICEAPARSLLVHPAQSDISTGIYQTFGCALTRLDNGYLLKVSEQVYN